MNNKKSWISKALKLLENSLVPIPQELNELDWKEDISTNNTKITHHISAFANYPGGGYLVYGIQSKTGKIIGIDQNTVKLVIEKISNLSRDTLDPVVQIDHAIVDYNNFNILIIYIIESSIKPVHTKNKSIEDTYIRSGGSTRIASRQEVGALLLNSKSLRFEDLHASKLLAKEKVLELIDYPSILKLLHKPLPSTSDEILSWLCDEKMIKKINGGYYITNLGSISAAIDLNDFVDLARKNIRVIKYKGTNKIVTENEFPGHRGYAVGFEGLIQFISALLPHSEIIEKALRKKTSLYPSIALRELIANALIHQDFTVKGKGPMIEIFSDRIEISNPGKLLPSKKIDRLIGTNPESRNEMLASTFRRFNICEERGTGFQKALSAIELFGLPPIKFEEGENYFKVTMFAPKKFADMSLEERIETCYQHAVMKYLSNSAMTNTSLRERFKMHEKQRSMISRLIKESLDKGKIVPRDPKNKSIKFAEYLPYWA
jgi:predicted HTH transcriptional regulator